MKKVLAMIMAGGKGERLYPLTRDRAKPAVPFGGAFRIIDFTISNCINSNIRKINVLTQYRSLSLDRHIQRSWNILSERFGEYVYIIHAQQRINENWYKGTADAIYQNFYTLQQERPDLVLILSGDHIYKMDYRELINTHLKRKADLTIATYELDKKESKSFGVLEVNEEGRILRFQEKPARPRTVPGRPDSILINMGVYVFNTDVLVKRLIENAKKTDTQHDFGKNVIPGMLKTNRVFAHPFVDKKTKKPAYWKDVGTIEAYYDANIDLLEANHGQELFNPDWPIFSVDNQAAPARITGYEERNGTLYGLAINSILSRGCIIDKAHIERCILSPNISVGQFSSVTGSILLNNVEIGKNCRIKNTIIDKGVTVSDGTEIGYDFKKDSARFSVDDSGIVVIPKNTDL